MFEIDYVTLRELTSSLSKRLKLPKPANICKPDSRQSIKSAIDFIFKLSNELIEEDTILSESDIKNHVFLSIYSDLSNFASGDVSSIGNYTRNFYRCSKDTEMAINNDISISKAISDKAEYFLKHSYRKNFGNSNLFLVSKLIQYGSTDNRIYVSERNIIDYLITEYSQTTESAELKTINHDEKLIANGKLDKFKEYSSWINFMKKILLKPKLVENSKDNFSLLHIEKNWDLILISEILEKLSKSVLKEENKTRILYDLLAISVCPIVINRHKFIDEYFRATSYRLREKWLEQIFRVSLFYIPVIYYYTLDLLSENIADENKLKALLEQDKELFDSEMTKCISSLSDSMPKEINQCYDIDFKTVYTNFHKYVKANYLHFWQEKISDARISVSNNIEPVYYDHDLIKVVQQFQNSKRMFINRYHKYNEKEIERTLEKRIRNIFDDNLMERMHLLTDKQILAMVTGIIEEILDERYNEYASVFKNLRFEKVNGAKKIKNINDLKDKEIILGKTMEFICSNSENIKQILENYIMKSYKMTSDSIEYKKIRKLCYVIRAFNKEFVEKYGDKADCPELINYDNLSLDKEIENYNALDNA